MNTAVNDRSYRGFRVEPCFSSPATGRTLSSPKGWRSVDLNPGYTGMVGGTWFSSLDDFRYEVEQRYERLHGAVLGTRFLRDNEARDFRGALSRLEPKEAQQVQAMLERGIARSQEMQQAQQRAHEEQQQKVRKEAALLKAAPDLLAALQSLTAAVAQYVNGHEDWPEMETARAAIAKATGE